MNRFKRVSRPATLILFAAISATVLVSASVIQLRASTANLSFESCGPAICTSDSQCTGQCACQNDNGGPGKSCSTIVLRTH